MPEQQVQQCLVRLEVMNGVPAVVRLAHNESRDRRVIDIAEVKLFTFLILRDKC